MNIEVVNYILADVILSKYDSVTDIFCSFGNLNRAIYVFVGLTKDDDIKLICEDIHILVLSAGYDIRVKITWIDNWNV
jgi:hypothetical protein